MQEFDSTIRYYEPKNTENICSVCRKKYIINAQEGRGLKTCSYECRCVSQNEYENKRKLKKRSKVI